MHSELSPSEVDAFNEGFEAAFNGADELMDNHYPPGSNEHLSWNDGYQNFFEQEEERRRRENAKRLAESKDPVLARLRSMTMEQVAKLIAMPLSSWPGNCFGISSAIVRALNWADAEAVYGLYTGPVSPRCKLFKDSAGMVRHGWVVTREGFIVDPTWWVFDACEPTIRVLQPGTDAFMDAEDEYDEGAEGLADLGRPFWPPTQPGKALVRIEGEAALTAIRFEMARLLGTVSCPQEFTREQLSWICRMPYNRLGRRAADELYGQMARQGHAASVIPTDHMRRWKREQRWFPQGEQA